MRDEFKCHGAVDESSSLSEQQICSSMHINDLHCEINLA